MTNYKNVIFDMDGVLIDNSEGIKYCVRYAAGRLGIEAPDDETLKRFIGPALNVSLKTYMMLSDEEADLCVRYYREKYVTDGINMFRLYDGIADVIKTLAEAGVKCSLSSGKPEDSAKKILQNVGLLDYFTVVAGATFPVKTSSKDAQLKRAIVDKPAIMVGDRVFDLESAYKAKIDSIFVTYGFGDKSDLMDYKPTYTVDSANEILKVVLD